VISLVLNYLVVKMTNLHFYDEGELLHMNADAAQAIRDYDGMQWWFLEHTYIYILLSIPASAIFLFLVFKAARQQYNIAETAVIILFTISQGVLIQTMLYAGFGWIKSGPFLRGLETVNMFILILYATTVMYQLMPATANKAFRLMLAVVGGAGLAVVWIASAFMLYILLT
jgi:hypothetical protein